MTTTSSCLPSSFKKSMTLRNALELCEYLNLKKVEDVPVQTFTIDSDGEKMIVPVNVNSHLSALFFLYLLKDSGVKSYRRTFTFTPWMRPLISLYYGTTEETSSPASVLQKKIINALLGKKVIIHLVLTS